MAILASDDFAGLGTGDPSGRTLNNAGGGTETWTWASTNMTGNGDGTVRGYGGTDTMIVDAPGTVKHRVRVNPNSETNNLAVWANRALANGDDSVLLLLAGSQTSLRVSSFTSGSRTDHATTGITAPGTTFWLELEIDGLLVTCRILNNDLSVRDTASHTFTGSLPSGGDYWGYGFFQDGQAALWDDPIFESADAGGQTLEPPLLTNSQTFYSPTVTGGAAPQILAPSLLTNTQTFYVPSVAVVGFTAAYILANTGPVGANPAGFMYEVAGLVDPDDYMTYTTVSGPTPGGGTLIEYPDGTFEYTGGAPAIWVVQIKINGVDYFETTTVYLYDQEFTLLPPLLVNTQTFFSPTVTGGGAISLLPPLLVNQQTFYRPTITGGIPAPSPVLGRSGSQVAAQIVQPICRPIVRPMT